MIFAEADSVEEAQKACAEFPLAKAGLLTFECIPFGPYGLWESLFAEEHKSK